MDERKPTPQARYDKANTKTYCVKVVIRTEPEIFRKLQSVSNVSGYIKRLISEDISKNGI